MLLVGQVAATIAAAALAADRTAVEIVEDPHRLRALQLTLLRGVGGPGVLVWPWQDLDPASPSFEAASMLALTGIWPFERDDFHFRGDEGVDTVLAREVLARVSRAFRERNPAARPLAWVRPPGGGHELLTWADLGRELASFALPVAPGLAAFPTRRLLRADFARMAYHLWQAAERDAGRAVSPARPPVATEA
jgi:hypothetical protein